MQIDPGNPIDAVTHPDPYPNYACLVTHQPLYFENGWWVASSAEAVQAVLSSEICRARPINEPVPKALLDSPAADLFGNLVRMTDGERHHPMKHAISATLTAVDQAAQQANRWAEWLLHELRPNEQTARLNDFNFQLSAYILASLLGVPDDKLHQTALWVGDYVACLAPAASAEQLTQGKAAAACLLDLFESILAEGQPGLLATLAQHAKSDARAVAANGIGFLTQAYEATAGLIGNTLLMLAGRDDLRQQVMAYPELLNAIIHEVLRYDSPVQNTRRFVAEDGIIAGQQMHKGEAILVVLAAANRDACANPHPERFDLFRAKRQIYTFGVGVHACAGQDLAVLIAAAGIQKILSSGINIAQLRQSFQYRPSVNGRIPVFGA